MAAWPPSVVEARARWRPNATGYPLATAPGTSAVSDAVALLRLPTSDGSGQACHPSVVRVPEGFGRHKQRYWMANTPYPNNRHDLENPEIFSSHDGFLWQVPSGTSNPLVASPAADWRCHHSDPCLLWHECSLIMYYRTSDARGQQRRDILSRIICTDGCSWSAPVTVLEDATGRLLLSPAVQVIGEMFYLWTVEAAPDARHLSIVRRCSHDGCSWSGPRPVTLVWLDATLAEPWHVDVVRHDDLLILVGSAREPSRQGTQRFFSAVGDVNDLGLRWHPQRPLSATRYMFEAGKPYRASYLPPGRDSEMGRLYTSSTDRHGMWWTACRPWLFRMDAR